MILHHYTFNLFKESLKKTFKGDENLSPIPDKCESVKIKNKGETKDMYTVHQLFLLLFSNSKKI